MTIEHYDHHEAELTNIYLTEPQRGSLTPQDQVSHASHASTKYNAPTHNSKYRLVNNESQEMSQDRSLTPERNLALIDLKSASGMRLQPHAIGNTSQK